MMTPFDPKILSLEQGKRLKYLREITHLSRRAFALKHSFSPSTLQNWEEGRYECGITEKTALTFLRVFKTENIDFSINWLIYGEGEPPKHHFVSSKKTEILELSEIGDENKLDELKLLQQAIENEKKYKNNKQLFEAAASGRYNEVVNLIASGVTIYLSEGSKIKPYNSKHNTPLHLAALGGYLDIVKYLVKKGASINVKNRKNQTPLHLAVHNAHKDIIKYLVTHGAEINAIEDEGDTPLAWAVYKGQTEILTLLIELKGNTHTQNKMGYTPLHWAAEKGYIDIAKTLLENSCQQDLKIRNYENNTPLLLATQNGHVEMVKFLLQKTL